MSVISWENAWAQIMRDVVIPLKAKLEEENVPTRFFSNNEYRDIYTLCFNICTQKQPYNWSDKLYSSIGETLSEYLTLEVLPKLQSKQGKDLLNELVRRSNNHNIMNNWFRRMFMYLDRYHVKYHQLPAVAELGDAHLKNIILGPMRERVAAAIGDCDDGVEKVLLICAANRVYEERGLGALGFQPLLLETFRSFYAKQVQEWLAVETMSTAEYIQRADLALKEEQTRVTACLTGDIVAQLLQEVDAQLRVGARRLVLQDLSKEFPVIAADGPERMEDKATPFITAMFAFHTKITNVQTDPQLAGSTLYSRAVNYSFGHLLNRDNAEGNNPAELLAAYCDKLLKTGSTEKLSDSDSEVEEYLEKTVQLFSYLTDQDLFAEIYRNQLARRLLDRRSASDDMERLMISKLKSKCGAQFTAKMEGMLNDLAIGTEHAAGFEIYYNERAGHSGAGKMDFSVQVLTRGHWPCFRNIDTVKLPPCMQRCIQIYQEHYAAKTSHRRLQWTNSLGQCSIKGTFNKKAFELQVTTLQAIAMLAFNKDVACPGGTAGAPISFVTLQESLGLPEDILKRVLHSLVCGKHKILLKCAAVEKSAVDTAGVPVGSSGTTGAGIDTHTDDSVATQLDDIAVTLSVKVKGAAGRSQNEKDKEKEKITVTDTYAFNDQFTCPTRKVRIPMSSLEESHNPKRVEEDRSLAIEAAIVRIMKAHGALEHQLLVAEVLTSIAFFRPDPKVIKQRIESLIDREFLQRDTEVQNAYKYLA